LGNEFKAIDYEDAGLGDPYFDVAKVAIFYAKPIREKVLFTTYLGRKPSATENAKLYLMKQVVLIKMILDFLGRLSEKNVHQYGLIKTPSTDFVRECFELKIDLSKSENSLKFLKALLTQVFSNFESQEFKDAVNVLSKK
jgi:hypothetical protein